MTTDDNQGVDAYRDSVLESLGHGLTLTNVPALEAASMFQKSLQEIEGSGPALIGPGFAGYFEEVPALEEPAPELPEAEQKPNLRPVLKYLTVTGYFNRSHKREVARRIEHNKKTRRAISYMVCSFCQLAYMGKINRCQCKVSKRAK